MYLLIYICFFVVDIHHINELSQNYHHFTQVFHLSFVEYYLLPLLIITYLDYIIFLLGDKLRPTLVNYFPYIAFPLEDYLLPNQFNSF